MQEVEDLISCIERANCDFADAIDDNEGRVARGTKERIAWETLEAVGAGLDRYERSVDDLIRAINEGGLLLMQECAQC